MSIRSGQPITVEFDTHNRSTGAAVNSDSLPTGNLVVNGVDNAASVTVTNKTTGRYKAAVTLPTLGIGDEVQVIATATVSTVTYNQIIFADSADMAIDGSGRMTLATTQPAIAFGAMTISSNTSDALTITSTSLGGNAVTATGNASSGGAAILGHGGVVISNSIGNAVSFTSTGSNGSGLVLNGNGSGPAIVAQGGPAASGIKIVAGTGNGIDALVTSGSPLGFVPAVEAAVTFAQAATALGTTPVSSGTITVKRGDSVSAGLTGLGNITGRSKLWFTAKPSGSFNNIADTASTVQITESGGLLYLAGSAYGTSSDGSLTVNHADTGDVTIALLPAAAAQLVPGNFHFDIQVEISGVISTLTEGDLVVRADVTRATA